ncbi:L-threonate dehydrogenase [Rhizobacter sp. Root404]|uniref:L-threonate dehydrogenase n=1 Tax=Rhizobacter sp. Root404 TaxID=1736528 RepID=UPI0006F9B9BE|nr:L-threonate dehydrogenase [Rhizobacter sp. Root404]KQW37852.1 3-hydroxyisobutyrate dehydrogenase [Rhizobacter sp. Root404]
MTLPPSSHAGQVLGVVGLGSMGFGAALTALRNGVTTIGLDTRAEARERFVAEGGRATDSLAELGAQCDAVVVLVVNAAQTEEVLFGAGGLAGHLRAGAVVICSATVDPTLPPQWQQRLAAKGLLLIDAPVSGGATKAAAGQMTVMASGEPAAFAAAGALLDAIAGKVYRLGDVAGVGSTVKMVNQHLAGVHIAAACEAMALGMRAGAEPRALYEVICNSAGMSWMFQNRVPHILDGDYTPLSAVNIFIKDLGIVLDAARKLQFPLPLAATAHQLYLATAAAGHGAEDDSAVIKFYAGLAGIELPQAAVKP